MGIKKVQIGGKTYTIKGLKKVGEKFYVTVNDRDIVISFGNVDPKSLYESPFTVWVNDEPRKLQVIKRDEKPIMIKLNGKTYEPRISRLYAPKTPKMQPEGIQYEDIKPSVPYKQPIEAGGIVAPMSGRIVLIKKNVGDSVKEGDTICVLEAMKMENEITAPKSGIIKKIEVKKGAGVNRGDLLVVIE